VNRSQETRLLAKAFTDPVELRKKLVLAIALAPPKSRRSKRKIAIRRGRGK
jgi:hypothetical protein